MVEHKNNRYVISKDICESNKNKCSSKNFLYITNKNIFIVESIAYSISTLVKSNRNIGTIYVLEDIDDTDFLNKAVKLWKTQFRNIKTISIKSILSKFNLNELYNVSYKNRYGIQYDPIVNSKILIPLIVDQFDCSSLLFIDSDMEVNGLFDFMFDAVQQDIGLYGLLEPDHVNDHDNQDVVSKKLADNGYDFSFEQKSGSLDYLNTGILLFNLDYYRRFKLKNDVEKFIKDCFVLKNKCKFDFPEQDTMNLLWTKKCLWAPDYGVFSYKKNKLADAKVIHYIWAGGGKEELKAKINDFMFNNIV